MFQHIPRATTLLGARDEGYIGLHYEIQRKSQGKTSNLSGKPIIPSIAVVHIAPLVLSTHPDSLVRTLQSLTCRLNKQFTGAGPENCQRITQTWPESHRLAPEHWNWDMEPSINSAAVHRYCVSCPRLVIEQREINISHSFRFGGRRLGW